MSKDPCRPHTGNTQWSMWVCLLTWDCLLHYNFHNMAYKKMFNLIKWGVELKMNWLNWSIPISSGFQFQFNSNSKSFNSIPIQFMLNWIELIINSNSIHELIRALMLTCHWWGPVAFTCKQFHEMWSGYQSARWVWKLLVEITVWARTLSAQPPSNAARPSAGTMMTKVMELTLSEWSNFLIYPLYTSLDPWIIQEDRWHCAWMPRALCHPDSEFSFYLW